MGTLASRTIQSRASCLPTEPCVPRVSSPRKAAWNLWLQQRELPRASTNLCCSPPPPRSPFRLRQPWPLDRGLLTLLLRAIGVCLGPAPGRGLLSRGRRDRPQWIAAADTIELRAAAPRPPEMADTEAAAVAAAAVSTAVAVVATRVTGVTVGIKQVAPGAEPAARAHG